MKKLTSVLAILLAILFAVGFGEGTVQREIVPAMTDRQIEKTELTEQSDKSGSGEINGGVVCIAATSEGLEELDQLLEDAMIYAEYGEEDGVSVLNVSVEFQEVTVVEAKFAAKDGKLDLMLPGLTDECYEVDLDSILEEIGCMMEEEENGSDDLLPSLNILDENKVKVLLTKYALKLVGLVSFRSLEWESRDYTLSQLGETLPCTKVTIKPDREQWKKTLTNILTTAREDAMLKEVMEQLFRSAYQQSSLQPGYTNFDGTEDEFVEENINGMYEGIDAALDSIDSLADALDGVACTVALNEGKPCSVRFSKGENGLAYEGYGKVEEERRDVVYLFAAGEKEEDVMLIVENSMTLHENEGSIMTGIPAANVTAQLWYDLQDKENPEINGLADVGEYQLAVSLDLEETGFEAYAGLHSETFKTTLFVHQEEQHVDVTFPEGEKHAVNSLTDLTDLAGTFFVGTSVVD